MRELPTSQVSKEASWRQMSVKSFRDGSQWPAIFSSTPDRGGQYFKYKYL